ncbi:MAG: hypothetical protein IJS67_03660, partial [Clostridia bacterium]|nr:hypothetical protein [Clostridia bacterium]
EEAENRLNSALELTGLDYRVYMAFVAAKTKNYTDLKDETHKTYLNKAISVADADGKKEIKRLYKNYYIKAGLDKEQLSAYYEEEARLKKAKAEKGLKNLIPEYLVKEKRNKVFVWIFPAVFALSLAFAVLFFVYYDIWMSLISAGTAIVGYLFFRVWFVNRDKVRIFNDVLDLYDLLETTSLSGEMLVKAYDALIKLYKRFADNDPVFSIEREVETTVDLLTETGDEKIDEFINNKLRH